MNKRILQIFVRVVSDVLTPAPKCLAVAGNPSIGIAEALRRFAHFHRGSKCTYAFFGPSEMPAPHHSGLLAFVAYAVVGRVLFLRDGKLQRLLQKLLPFKFFIIDWTSTFRLSSWRFQESRSPRWTTSRSRCSKPLRVLAEKRSDTVLVLGTGPSSAGVFSKVFDGVDVITCNTSVKSHRLYSERNVVAHCFSDATFLTGPSSYSLKFLEDVKLRMEERPFAVICDVFHQSFLCEILGNRLSPRLEPIFLDPTNEPSVELGIRKWQYSYGNVMTALLLPVAATWYKKVILLGFDGKGKTQGYYWKHQDLFQYTELLPTVKAQDPGFFQTVDFDKYSRDHEKDLSALLDAAEAKGVTIKSANASSSAAIQKRFDETLAMSVAEPQKSSVVTT